MTLLVKESPVRVMWADRITTAKKKLRDIVNSYALLIVIASLVITWVCIVTLWPIEFWYSEDEYAYMSLAHALNLEVRLRDGLWFNDSGLGNHPGIPFYLVSWICLRVVSLLTGHRDAVAYALAEPDTFYLATRIAAGSIALASVVGAYHVLAPLEPWKRAVAISSFFAADSWSLLYGMTSLGNETFALPLAVVFFWCVNKVASSPKEALVPWLYVGGAATLGYLVKPAYLSILAGGLALACIMAVRYPAPTGAKFKFLCKLILTILGSFAALSAGVLLVVDGPSEFAGLIRLHTDFLSHTDILGGGRGHSFSFEPILTALITLMSSSSALPFVLALAIAGLAYVVYAEGRSGTLDDQKWLWCVAAVVPLGFASLAILSHFRAYYYLPAVSCFLPFILKPVLARRGFAVVAMIVILIAGMYSMRDAAYSSAHHKSVADRMKADEATIDSTPLDDGEARLWTYGLTGKVFVREIVLQFAGLQSYIHERENGASKDISSYADVVRPYRYIIFARGSYRNIETLRDRAMHNQLVQPNGMAVAISDDAVYRQLLETIIVEISPASPKH
jgi:hypothetical protein